MFISKKCCKTLEKKVADLEKQVQSQPLEIVRVLYGHQSEQMAETDFPGKGTYISERIINIAQLESLLREEQILIEQMKGTNGSADFRNLLNQLEQVHKKTIQFEFCLERRKTQSQ